MSDSNPPDDQITVTGTREWGYALDVTDRGTGAKEQRWIDDRNETVKLDAHKSLTTETDLAADAQLTLRGNDGADVMMVRPLADTNTRADIDGRAGNDTFAITTRDADQPMAKDAPRPQVNIDGGVGDDTVMLGGVSAENVVIQRLGDGYKVTDGTGTELNLKNVEFLRGRAEENAVKPAARELPRDARGVDLDGLNMREGEGIRLSDAQKPLIDKRPIQMEANWHAERVEMADRYAEAMKNGDYNPNIEMKSVTLSELGPDPRREMISPASVADVRAQIESTRGQEGTGR